VALVGVGNIGSALVSYKEFQKQGFEIRKVFDNDQRKIGSNHKGIVVSDIADLEEEISASNIEIAVIAVPAQAAQEVADRCVAGGIKAILNFAPVNLKVPDDVCLRTENMSMELEFLSFSRVNRNSFGRFVLND
jgi:redox-sensing transcriptional repressor